MPYSVCRGDHHGKPSLKEWNIVLDSVIEKQYLSETLVFSIVALRWIYQIYWSIKLKDLSAHIK